jgi:uncharacterized membrane protein
MCCKHIHINTYIGRHMESDQDLQRALAASFEGARGGGGGGRGGGVGGGRRR